MSPTGPDYKVYVSRTGNIFMTELAITLVRTLEQLSRPASLVQDELPRASPGTVNLVVAPHEFFTLLPDCGDRACSEAASHAISICTEQPGTTWFDISARFAAAGPVALDINPIGVTRLRAVGVPAHRLPLGYVEDNDRWHGDSHRERSVDLLFLGASTPRRDAFLAESASYFWPYRNHFQLFAGDRPVLESAEHFMTGLDKYDLLSSSRILLNIHRSRLGYFEWVRILEAMANGCLVLSEDSTGFEPLRPFEHFIQVPLPRIRDYAIGLLENEDLRAELARHAYDYLTTQYRFTDLLHDLLPTVERAAASLRTAYSSICPRVPDEHHRSRRGPITALRTRAAKTVLSLREREKHTRTELRRLLLTEIALRRSIEAAEASQLYGSVDHCSIECTPAYSSSRPDVSVILTVFNYQYLVREAIESVISAVGVRAELVIVDDHSTDNSVEIIQSWMAAHPWFPVCLIANAANRGLAAARNTAFATARAPYVFVLDADNVVYPHGLKKLLDAIEASDCAFAYGIIERFGSERGLLSHLPWDVDRLATGNYIDAMALIRRDVWNALGGYDTTHDVLGGLEDYEFWLRIASAGMKGHFVPQIVARYRCHPNSMTGVTALDLAPLNGALRSKYPWVLQS